MKNRIKLVRKELNLTQESFGKRLGVRKTAISKIENGENNLTKQMLRLICSEFNVNEDWLQTGVGEMFSQSETFSLDKLAKQRGCSGIKLELVKNLLELEEDDIYKLLKTFKPTWDLVAAREESSATKEDKARIDIEKEVEEYRLELEAMKKGKTLSVLDTGKNKIG